jgi:hypothetical protein
VIPKVTRKIKRFFFTEKDSSSSYIPNCCSVTFDDYCRKVDPFTQANNNKSFFNDFEFGSSSKSMQKKLGKPIFTKKQDSVTILVTKRKVAGFKFVFKLYFIEDKLVHFESECRNTSKIFQKALLETVIKKYDCDLETYSFNQNCAVKVSNLLNVRIQFFSTNRKHIEMMKSFKNNNSIDYSINKIFNLQDVVLNQYI